MVLLFGFSLILVKIIGKLWSEFLDILEVLPVCALCLCFESGDHVLDAYTYEKMTKYIVSRKSTYGYMITFARERCLGNQGYKSVLLYLLLRLSILQQLKHLKNFYG